MAEPAHAVMHGAW